MQNKGTVPEQKPDIDDLIFGDKPHTPSER